jgi:MFS family permease
MGPLQEREFRLLFAGQAVSVVGDGVAPLAIAFAVLDLTGSATDLGIVLAAQTLPFLLFLLVGGVWADRLPRQRVMLASDLVRAAAQGSLALLLLFGHPQLWVIVVLEVAYGSAEAFFRPASVGFLPEVISPGRLQEANALFGMSTSLSRVAGPLLAGLLVATLGAGSAVGFDALTFLVSASFLLRLRSAGRPRVIERRPFVRELAEGWSELRSHVWLWAVILESAVFLFVSIAPLQVLGPTLANQSLGGPKAWALIMTGLGLGTILGSSAALRFKPQRPIFVGMVLHPLVVPLFVLLALEAPVPVIAAGALVAGIELGLFGALWETTVQQHIPPAKLSRVSSYDWLGSVALMPLGQVLAGPVSKAIGLQTTLMASGLAVLVLAGTVLAIPDVRRVRRIDGPPQAVPAAAAESPLVDAVAEEPPSTALFPPGAATLTGPADPGGIDA